MCTRREGPEHWQRLDEEGWLITRVLISWWTTALSQSKTCSVWPTFLMDTVPVLYHFTFLSSPLWVCLLSMPFMNAVRESPRVLECDKSLFYHQTHWVTRDLQSSALNIAADSPVTMESWLLPIGRPHVAFPWRMCVTSAEQWEECTHLAQRTLSERWAVLCSCFLLPSIL